MTTCFREFLQFARADDLELGRLSSLQFYWGSVFPGGSRLAPGGKSVDRRKTKCVVNAYSVPSGAGAFRLHSSKSARKAI